MESIRSYTMEVCEIGPGRGGQPPSAQWMDTIDRNQTNTIAAKGLRNAPGENNCFLNSAVQVFWHLDVFRRSYRRLTGHLCMGNACIFCALKVIFTQFQYSDHSSLTPDALRKALANTFMNQQRFQLGHMDDAAECFENILRRIHFHIANAYSEDSCQAAHCLPHAKFAMTVLDQLVCICGASSDPFTFHELVHYVSTNSLVSQYRGMMESGDILHPDRFGLLLRNAGAVGDVRDCPKSCGKRVQLRKTLLNCPDVVSIGLVWDSDRPSAEMINEVVQSIGTTIHFPDLFHSVMVKGVKNQSNLPKLQLSAIVCYYGKHYSTFVFSSKLNGWIYFDDTTVREIGPNWETVVDKCCKGHYQPLLLLYTNPTGTPVPTETAPKKIVMAPGFATPGKGNEAKKPEQCRRSHEGSKRAVGTDIGHPTLPNKEMLSPDAESGNSKKGSEHSRHPSFLLAVTGKNGKPVYQSSSSSQSEYAVPKNNMPVKQRLPGGQGSLMYEAESDGRRHRPNNLPLGDTVDGYNYTLSTSNPYRRPSINSPEQTMKALAQNFSRTTDMQRKESFKKGNGKIPADVIRNVDPARLSSTSSSDSDQNEGTHYNNNSNARPRYDSAPKLPPKHSRTRSISCEETPQNLSADNIDMHQHMVVMPKPSMGHNMMDSMTHTPVQSGLATLPRNKKKVDNDSLANNHQSQSKLQHQNSYPETQNERIHSQHAAFAKQSPAERNDCRSAVGNKPPKPAKPEKKSSLSNKKKSEPPAAPERKTSLPGRLDNGSPPSDKYINRKMVESILSMQSHKLTRQGSNASTVSQTSNTSYDSDTSSLKSQSSGVVSTETPYDNISLERDSGYGTSSSDRNSSSSTGSTTFDPMMQYFLSKSMIPPKNINTENLNNFLRSGQSVSGDRYGQQVYNVTAQQNNQYQMKGQLGFQGQGQIPPEMGLDPKQALDRKQLYDPAIVRSHSQDKGNPSFPNGTNLDYKNNYSGSNQMKVSTLDFKSLWDKAEELMDQCILMETSDEYRMAHNHCQEAIECLKKAINIPTIPQSYFNSAQKMHNSCILKSKSLQKRFVRQESTSSTNSDNSISRSSPCPNSFSDPSLSSSSSSSSTLHPAYKDCKSQGTHGHQSQKSFESVHSRSSSRDSIDSVIENKNYMKDKNSVMSCDNCSKSQDSPTPVCKEHSSHNIDIYATLPRKRKGKVATNQMQGKESPVPQIHHGRTSSSGSITPTPMDGYQDSDSSSQPENTEQLQYKSSAQQVKSNRAEIRHLSNGNQYSYPNSQQQYHNAKVCTNTVTPQTNKAHPVLPSKPKWASFVPTSVSNSNWEQVKKAGETTSPSEVKNFGGVKRHSSFNGVKDQPCLAGDTIQTRQWGTLERPRKAVQLNPPTFNCIYSEDICSGIASQPQGIVHGSVLLCCTTNHHKSLGRSTHSEGSSNRPMTPDENNSEHEEFRPSVRDLASRFESGTSISCDQDTEDNDQSVSNSLGSRHRSKSESDFRAMETRPKSVLSRRNKPRGNRPRKSVTFSDNVALVASSNLFEGLYPGDTDPNSGYVSDEEGHYYVRGESYSDNDCDDDDSTASPTEPVLPGQMTCSLCGKHGVSHDQQYCHKCYMYLQKFQPRN